MSIFVFLGPTLPVAQARDIFDATYLPPVSMGDIYDLMKKQPRAIAIIDGLFQRIPSVWHKEILFALSQGVRVFGSSSMGALRAAELHPFGMEGVGRIFEAYRDGVFEDDDEVAVIHAPAEFSYRPLSEAMANIRDGLNRARTGGLISSITHDTLVRVAKEKFYPERSWPGVLEAGAVLSLPSEELTALKDFVRREAPNAKRDDAIALLRHLAQECADGVAPHQPDFYFESTFTWREMIEVEACTRPSRIFRESSQSGASPDAIRRHVRLAAPQRQEVLRSALLLSLVSAEAERRGLVVDPEKLKRAVERLAQNGSQPAKMSQEELNEVGQIEVLCDELLTLHRSQVDRFLPVELKRRGVFSKVAADVGRKWSHLKRSSTPSLTLEDAGVDLDSLMSWYQERFGPVETSTEEHAAELGFASWEELLSELVAQYIFETQIGMVGSE